MQIPGYTIIRELGRGGMATVYLARQDRLGRQVALKVMHPSAMAGGDFTSRFIKESQIIAQLQHPQIVTIYDCDSAGGLHYFSMEYLPNGTLSDLIARGLSTKETVDIIRRIAQALSIAHDRGVIHRDIKPQNILIRADGTPVITDFGIARSVAAADATQLTSFGMIVGSPRYMSPEQSMSRPIDLRSDLYSLGVVFYEMLTGELPYKGDDVISLAMKHCSAPLPVLPERLKAYQPILERLLAKRPEDRFASTQELIAALDAVTSGVAAADEPTRVVQRSEPPPPGHTAPLRRVWRLAALVVVPLLLAALVFYLGQRQHADDGLRSFEAWLPPADPNRPATTERYEALALEHLAADELPQSLELVELALGGNPSDERLLALRDLVLDHVAAERLLGEAKRLQETGALDESLAAIAQGLARIPGHPDLTALREQVETERTRQAAARADDLRTQAQAALDRGDAANAMRLARDGLALVPDNLALRQLERVAAERLERQRQLRDLAVDASRLIADGMLAEGMKVVEQGLALAPEDPELRDLKQTVLRQMERETSRRVDELRSAAEAAAERRAFSEALASIDQALSLRPNDPALNDLRTKVDADAREARATAVLAEASDALARGDLTEALRLADAGLKAEPGHSGLFAFRERVERQILQTQTVADTAAKARSQLQGGRLSEALESVEAGLGLVPNNPELLGLRGEILGAQQRRQEDEVAELLRHASQLLETGNLDESLALVGKALVRSPEQVEALALRREIEARQAQRARVQALLDTCTAKLPAQGALPAEVVAAVPLADACYREVLALAPDDPTALAKLPELSQALTGAVNLLLDAADPEAAGKAIAVLENIDPDNASLDVMRERVAVQSKLLPKMAVITGACFEMGAAPSDPDREPDERPHRVCVADFAIARYETRVAEFSRFVEATGYQTDAERGVGGVVGCWTFDRDSGQEAWGYEPWADWRRPNKYRETDPAEPVTCVSWNDANAYVRWLNEATGQRFRLPTEAEWEYAARAGTATTRFWGDAVDRGACRHANVADSGQDWSEGFPCDDGYEWAAPAGHFSPNPWGLYDILGNAMEWTCSEYDPDYRGSEKVCAPNDSAVPMTLRGGAWNSGPPALRASYRNRNFPEARYNFVGFRLARDPGTRHAGDGP